MHDEGFRERTLRELSVESVPLDRHRAMLPLVERQVRIEREGRAGTEVWARSLESIARKIVDEWPFDDPLGRAMLGQVQAARRNRR